MNEPVYQRREVHGQVMLVKICPPGRAIGATRQHPSGGRISNKGRPQTASMLAKQAGVAPKRKPRRERMKRKRAAHRRRDKIRALDLARETLNLSQRDFARRIDQSEQWAKALDECLLEALQGCNAATRAAVRIKINRAEKELNRSSRSTQVTRSPQGGHCQVG